MLLSVLPKDTSSSVAIGPKKKKVKREKKRFQRTYAVCLQGHKSLKTFKAILQALRGGGVNLSML